MTTTRPRPTRDLLCEAAIRTASRNGLLSMTLDNVAREAGVSKGGVMYHFPTKDDLVRAMLEYFGQRLERLIVERVADDPNPKNRWARAFLDIVDYPDATKGGKSRSLEADNETFRPEVIDQFMLSTLAAAVNNPSLLEPLRAVAHRMQERFIADSGGELDQLLIWLAVDGLFFWQFVGLIRRSDPLFQRICKDLRQRLERGSRKPAVAGRSKS